MNLGGWDTMSAAKMPLINAALAKETTTNKRRFSFAEGTIKVEGTFGPWRILDGGSMQLLHMAFPIAEGSLTGLRDQPVPLDGLELMLEVRLRLLPNQAGDGVDLMLASSRQAESNDAVRPLQVIDPDNRFPFIGDDLVMAALGHALNANLEAFTYALAHLKTRGSTSDWLRLPHVDWANIRLGDGRQYLAVFGSARKPGAAMALDKVDPNLFRGNGSAYFAASYAVFYEKLLAPHLTKEFRPRTRFRAGRGGVSSAPYLIRSESALRPQNEIFGGFNPIKKIFPPKNKIFPPPKKRRNNVPQNPAAGIIERLTVEQMTFRCATAALSVDIKAVALLRAAKLNIQVNLAMPFRHDAKTNNISFAKDKNPNIRHQSVPRGDVDLITRSLGFVVTSVIIELAKKQVHGMIQMIATNMQSFNNPTNIPTSWAGVRDFRASQAVMDRCFWFCDTRPE